MFTWPASTKRITSYFRPSHRATHNGIDIAEPGTHNIYAAADGTVTRSYTSDSYGECIFILHSIGGQQWETVYAHLRKGSRKVSVGAKVKAGQVIGIMGNTGRSTGQHLHFELHRGRWNASKSNAVYPMKYLDNGKTTASSGGNSAIKTIQSTLNSRYRLRIKVDGIFGQETKAALITGLQTELNTQFKRGLIVDGKWGPKTKAACVTVRSGARGNIAWLLQAALTVAGHDTKGIDGVFGKNTEQALRNFQRANGLSVDGVAGPATFAKLFE